MLFRSTKEFADAIIANIGKKPSLLKDVTYNENTPMNLPKYQRKQPKKKELLGVDLFVHWPGSDPLELSKIVQQINLFDVHLTMITNRGIKVWPNGFPETFCTDHWRCRFKSETGSIIKPQTIIELLRNAAKLNIDVVKTENLYSFDGVPAFSLGQGQ